MVNTPRLIACSSSVDGALVLCCSSCGSPITMHRAGLTIVPIVPWHGAPTVGGPEVIELIFCTNDYYDAWNRFKA